MRVTTITSRRNRVFDKGSKVRDAIRDHAGGKLRKRYMQEFNKRVADWDHRPKFQARLTFQKNDIRLFVFPAGPNKKYWLWTSRGTKRHPIVARNYPTLRFRVNYSARTRPVGKYGVGSGRSSGPWGTPKIVPDHPGTAARLFEESIADDLEDFTNSTVRQAVINAYR